MNWLMNHQVEWLSLSLSFNVWYANEVICILKYEGRNLNKKKKSSEGEICDSVAIWPIAAAAAAAAALIQSG